MPPVKLFGVHARYANATYTAASKAGNLAAVETELLGFKEVGHRHILASFARNEDVSAAASPGRPPKSPASPRPLLPATTRS